MATKAQLQAELARGQFARPEDLYRCCLAALDLDLAAEVLALIGPLTSGAQGNDARAWQIAGLAHRTLQDSAAAHGAFVRAAQLAPRDGLIAQSLARTALEAGYPAAALFAAARQLSPADGGVLQGRAAALFAEGQGASAVQELQVLLEANPAWLAGHKTFARIQAMNGAGDQVLDTIRLAATKHPASLELWAGMIEIAMQADDYALARECVAAARRGAGNHPEFDRAEAICLGETGAPTAAQLLFERLPVLPTAKVMIHPLRNLIRLGRYDEALKLAGPTLPGDDDLALWPYRALLWRVTQDPRWDALEGDSRLIGTYDLTTEIGPIAELVATLRQVHNGTGRPIDQSVRGGTQTDGNVLARAEPALRRLRVAVLDAVQTHVSQLPAPRAGHPTLLNTRSPLHLQGAWSVRLLGGGFHVDHVHPQGWLSSAFYAALPEGSGGIGRPGQDEAGWLTFGEARSLIPDLAAFRTIEPRVGQLVLFPSTLWHGTRPFGQGERITVAFDVARPRQ